MTTTHTYIDQATMVPITIDRELPRRPGEVQKYADEYGRIWRYFAATRSITYLKQETEQMRMRDRNDALVRKYA